MNIVKPYAKIISINGIVTAAAHSSVASQAGADALRFVEWCGRISHRSEDAQTPDSWQRFIKAVVLEHGDWSITEHVNVSVDFLVDRGITHEIVRHRLMSFTQESTRFVNYEKKMPPSFVAPAHELMGKTDEESGNEVFNSAAECSEDVWSSHIRHCELAYQAMLRCGATPQIARSVFPNALASRIIVTANLRSWRHFLIMRTTKEAHPQMREVTIPLLQEFKDNIPLLYDDIEPLSKQSEGMKRAR